VEPTTNLQLRKTNYRLSIREVENALKEKIKKKTGKKRY